MSSLTMSLGTISPRGSASPPGRRSGARAAFLAWALAMLVVCLVRPAEAQLFGGGQDDRRTAENAVRINQLENQMRSLNGQIEQLTFQVKQLQDSITRMQKDYEFRLQEIENGQAGQRKPPQKKSEAPVQPAPAAPTLTTNAPLGASTAMVGEGDETATYRGVQPVAPASAPQPGLGAPPATLGELPADDQIGGVIGGAAPFDLGAQARGTSAQNYPASGYPAAQQTYPQGGLAPDSTPRSRYTEQAMPPGVRTGPSAPAGAPAQPTETRIPGVNPRYAAVPPTANPRDEYDAAYGYILNGEYALAETSFRAFLSNHPTDRRVGSAQYWLGESYIARGMNREAADSFLKSYTQFPDGPKAPDSLLKLGLSLNGLGEKKAACATYEELLTKYPKATKAVRDRAQAEKSRGKC